VRTLVRRLGVAALCALLVAGCRGSSSEDSPGDAPSGSPTSSTGSDTGADTGVGGY
jgi:hypothetical protein